MANIVENVMLAGKSTSDVFEAAKVALPKAGFEVWKLREIAWMVLGKGKINEIPADGNAMAMPGGLVNVSVGAEGVSEADLRAAAQKIIAALKESVK
jgi:hypothetical protein